MAIALRRGQPGGLSLALDQHLAQTVGPGGRRLGNTLLDGREIDLAAILRIGAHDDVHARVDGSGDLHLRLDALAAEPVEDDLLDTLPYLRAVAIARHVDQHGIETMERVAAREHAHRAALIEIDDSAHDADEVLDVRLEQLLARIGLEDVQDRLAVVAVGVEVEELDDSLDLAPQNGNVAGTAVVRAGSPQARGIDARR